MWGSLGNVRTGVLRTSSLATGLQESRNTKARQIDATTMRNVYRRLSYSVYNGHMFLYASQELPVVPTTLLTVLWA